MLESIMAVAASAPPRYRPRTAREDAMRMARTCYDHFAGLLGVAIADSLCANGHVILSDDGGEVTETGMVFLRDLGADIAKPSKRPFCRHCLDWTERRPHLSGTVGALIATRCFDLGWVERERNPRTLKITSKGQDGFRRKFGFDLKARAASAA